MQHEWNQVMLILQMIQLKWSSISLLWELQLKASSTKWRFLLTIAAKGVLLLLLVLPTLGRGSTRLFRMSRSRQQEVKTHMSAGVEDLVTIHQAFASATMVSQEMLATFSMKFQLLQNKYSFDITVTSSEKIW